VIVHSKDWEADDMAEISARLKSVSPGAACQEFSLRYGLFSSLWIRHDFSAEAVQCGSGSWSDFAVTKKLFIHKNMLNLGNRS
jgi:hypothetical protein